MKILDGSLCFFLTPSRMHVTFTQVSFVISWNFTSEGNGFIFYLDVCVLYSLFLSVERYDFSVDLEIILICTILQQFFSTVDSLGKKNKSFYGVS